LLNNGTILLFNKNDVHIVDDFMHSESRLVKIDNVDEVEVRDNVGINVGNDVGINVGINENQQKIMKLLLENPHYTAQQLSEVIGISKRRIESNISILKSLKIIQRDGGRRYGYWIFK
jgi:predicted HTH transcriptional regulator